MGSKHAWTFDLVDDNGWRVCDVVAPVICGTVLNCEATAAPATSAPGVVPGLPGAPVPVGPTPSEDLLRHPREMLPCGPRDPFRELHNCPEVTP